MPIAPTRSQAGRSPLAVLFVLAALAVGVYVFTTSSPTERMEALQDRFVARLAEMEGEAPVDEAQLRELVARAHARIGSPAPGDDFDEAAYGQQLARAMAQQALDDERPDLSARCSLLMVEAGSDLGG